MLAFAALAVDDPMESLEALADGAELYAHPSPALSSAQALAAATGLAALDGTPVAAVVIVARDDEAWGACCARCYRAAGDVHAPGCTTSGPVMPHEAVVRPVEQLTRR